MGIFKPLVKAFNLDAVNLMLLIAIITYFEVPSLVTPGPALAFIVVAVTPMLALCLSAALFSNGVVASIVRWQKQAQAASVSLARITISPRSFFTRTMSPSWMSLARASTGFRYTVWDSSSQSQGILANWALARVLA